MSQTTENTSKILKFVADKFQKNELDNDSLVQLIELCGNYLNIQSIADYAKTNNMSYNGVKNHRQVVKVFKQKFIIDNE
jgi:hypothetical protein